MSGVKGSSPERAGAIIAAAGTSQRMGGVDKLFYPLGGLPLLAWTVQAFEDSPAIQAIVLVVHPLNLAAAQRLGREQGWRKVGRICEGGQSRQDSVGRGLEHLSDCAWVVIHDGARPCLGQELISQALQEARETGAAVAGVPVDDTIKVVGHQGLATQTPPRPSLWAVQTPQAFRRDIIQAAYAQPEAEATDDASLVERLGYLVKVFPGSYENIKVTRPLDLQIAELILGRRRNGR